MNLPPLLFLGISALLAWLLGFPVSRLLVRWQVVDRPNNRSSHVAPTARGGGIAVLLTIFLLAAVWPATTLGRPYGPGAILLAAVLALAVVSFWDDLRSVPASIRFACQVSLAGLVLWSLQCAPVLSAWGVPAWAGFLIGIVWVAGYTNAFNFMDGINGLAGSHAVLSGLGMVLVAGSAGQGLPPPAWLCLLVAGSALGFLPHNFPRARMFLGDVGSAPLGFLLAVLVLWLAQGLGPAMLVPLLLLHTNFILDTGITLLRRILRGERWYEAHREHFYQKFIRSGKSHAAVTGWTCLLQAVTGGLLLFYFAASPLGRLLLAGAVLSLWLGYFLWIEARFAKTPAAPG